MCAHAIAKELGKKIMIASYAAIESKWVGEGPKNMRKIFKDAADQDAILFFDEADSFLSKRVNNAETGSDKHYNRMSNEMFQLLEEYDGVVIFATNLVSDFDKAFKSRILSFIEFTLPNADTRAKLIETMLPSKLPLSEPLSANIIQPLANCSEGFSGREIRKAILASLSEAALKGKTRFEVDDLLIGFESVKHEREAIEATASKQRGIITDFLEADEQNRSIVDICQWALNQKEGYTDLSKEEFYKICKVLNLEMPDLTISYKNKDIKNSADIVSASGRINETLMYVIQLLVRSDMSKVESDRIIATLVKSLGYDNITYAYEYYNSFKNLTSR
jgi:SpoVK/Ycf46/Vps4 family AAA+-type ATPase